MLILDLLALIVCICLVGAGIKIVQKRKQVAAAKDKERQEQLKGKQNAEAVHQAEHRNCVECGKPIDPHLDVYIGDVKKGSWWHRDCYRRIAI